MVAGASAHISSSKKGAVKEKKIRDMQSGVEVGRKGMWEALPSDGFDLLGKVEGNVF